MFVWEVMGFEDWFVFRDVIIFLIGFGNFEMICVIVLLIVIVLLFLVMDLRELYLEIWDFICFVFLNIWCFFDLGVLGVIGMKICFKFIVDWSGFGLLSCCLLWRFKIMYLLVVWIGWDILNFVIFLSLEVVMGFRLLVWIYFKFLLWFVVIDWLNCCVRDGNGIFFIVCWWIWFVFVLIFCFGVELLILK